VAVECVREVNLENQHMRFKDGSALDQREIFIQVALTSHRRGDSRHVPEYVGARLAILWSKVLVEEGCAIEVSIGARGHKESWTAGIRDATGPAILDGRSYIKRRRIGAKERLARNVVITYATVVTWYQSSLASEDCRLPALVALDAANLPSPDHFVQHATVVEEFFSFAERQFIDVADYEYMRNILDAETLFLIQVSGVLDAAGK
jgi:hypothetical protein